MDIKARIKWKPSHPDHRDCEYLPPKTRFLPAHVDLTPEMPPVYDQGDLGSCTANGIGACWQFALMNEKKRAPTPARLLIYYYERTLEGTVGQDAGAEIRDGMKVIAKQGCCDEALWPYDISKFAHKPSKAAVAAAIKHEGTQYLAVKQAAADIKGCLAAGFPVVFGFTVYDSFESAEVAKHGVVPMPGVHESVLGGHCVCIVGYDDETQRFICRNSWGTGWGVKGYFTMSYSYVLSAKLATDFWTLRVVA